jgi:hypothetical protein
MAIQAWQRKCKVTIDKDKVDSTESNFTVTITEDMLPSEMFDADGTYPANSDGSDIRFSSDENGATELAFGIVAFNIDNDPANGFAEIKVKIPSISSSTDTDIWIWYASTQIRAYDDDDTYGQDNAFDSSSKLYMALQESGAAVADEYEDLTSNDNHGRGGGGDGSEVPTATAFIMQNGQDFELANTEWIEVGHHSSLDITGALTMMSWINLESTQSQQIFIKSDAAGSVGDTSYGLQVNASNNVTIILFSTGAATFWVSDTALSNSTDYHLAVTWDGGTGGSGNVKLYIDGVEDETFDKTDTLDSNGETFNIGAKAGGGANPFDGLIDEVIINSAERSAGWIGTYYNNLKVPSTFASADTPMDSNLGVGGETAYGSVC